MNKAERDDLKSMLLSMRLETVREFTWELLVDAIVSIGEHEGDQVFKSVVDQSYKILKDFTDTPTADALLAVMRRYKKQLRETEPDSATAERKDVAYSTIHDYDGYLCEEEHFRTVFELKKPWRNFMPGQVIQYREPQRCIGGFVSGGWCLYHG